MLKTASLVDPANENPEQGDQEIQVGDQDEKEPAQKSHKSQNGQKWLNLKSGSVPKKQRPPEQRTLANEVRFLPLTLEEPLPN